MVASGSVRLGRGTVLRLGVLFCVESRTEIGTGIVCTACVWVSV